MSPKFIERLLIRSRMNKGTIFVAQMLAVEMYRVYQEYRLNLNKGSEMTILAPFEGSNSFSNSWGSNEN